MLKYLLSLASQLSFIICIIFPLTNKKNVANSVFSNFCIFTKRRVTFKFLFTQMFNCNTSSFHCSFMEIQFQTVQLCIKSLYKKSSTVSRNGYKPGQWRAHVNSVPHFCGHPYFCGEGLPAPIKKRGWALAISL